MFREIRRVKQKMTESENNAVLDRGEVGVLAVNGDDGYPYTVPVNYIYYKDAIYFHGAKSGHKIDGIRKDDKVSFCVIDHYENVPEKFTAYYRSVIVFGRAEEIQDEKEKYEVTEAIARKFSPDESDEKMKNEIEKEWNILNIIKISPEHISGKKCKEFINKD